MLVRFAALSSGDDTGVTEGVGHFAAEPVALKTDLVFRFCGRIAVLDTLQRDAHKAIVAAVALIQ